MDVSPAGGGNITSPNFAFPPSTYPTTFTCSTSYALTAVPNSEVGYIFDHWGGSYSSTSTKLTVDVSDGPKTVTAYFTFKTQGKSLQDAAIMINSNQDLIIIDVSATSDFNTSHMLCARNYPWNGTTFPGGISSLNPYKDDAMLIYDHDGSKSKAAASYLAVQGFKSIYYMVDGLDDWIAQGYETYMTAEDSSICTSIAPLAYAGDDQTVNENAHVTLHGQGPSGAAYLWTQTKGPNVALSDQTATQPTFTTPDLISSDAELVFLLTVTSGGLKDSDSVTVNVTWNNQAPTANAGPDQTVSPGSVVTLDGSGSSDPDSANLSYKWTIAGMYGVSTPTLSDSSSAKPTFTAPSGTGWIMFNLTVSDNGGKTSSDTVKITIQSSGNKPQINSFSADPTSINSGSSTTLTWLISGATNASIDNGVGSVNTISGSKSVFPTITTTYTLSASNANGTVTKTVTVTVTANINIQPPSNLAAKGKTSTQITLGWSDNSNNESGFKIEQKTGDCDSAGSWAQIAIKPANSVTHTVSGLTPDTIYSFRVKAYNASSSSDYSNCASAPTSPSGTPSAPTNLKATSTSSTKINLTWNDNSGNETGFKIYRKAGSGAWTLLTTSGVNIKAFNDAAATNNSSKTSYQYYVVAYNSSGNSASTNTATVPYQPTNLTAAKGTTSGTIKLKWNDKSSNETGFEIYRKSGSCSSTSTWTKVATLGANKTSWTDTGLSSGASRSYKIRSYCKTGTVVPGYGYSSWGNCVAITAP